MIADQDTGVAYLRLLASIRQASAAGLIAFDQWYALADGAMGTPLHAPATEHQQLEALAVVATRLASVIAHTGERSNIVEELTLNGKRYLTLDGAAKRLRVTRNTLKAYIYPLGRPRLSPPLVADEKFGNRLLFKVSTVDAFDKHHNRTPGLTISENS